MSFSLAYSEMTADEPGSVLPLRNESEPPSKAPRHSTMFPARLPFVRQIQQNPTLSRLIGEKSG